MMSDSDERKHFTFEVLDAFGDCTTLELVDTFRLQHGGAARDYCVVRPVSGDESLADPSETLWPDEEPSEVIEELRAFRLEPEGLAAPDDGMESLLLGQAVLALQHALAREDAADVGMERIPLWPEPARH